MLNYHLDKNGWTIILDDVDFKTVTQEDINQIARLLATNTCVVAKKQNLSVDDEVRISKMFKNPQPLFLPTDSPFQDVAVDKEGLVLRVTAEKNERGKTGVGAHPDDFDWHANRTWDKNRLPIIWLYAVKGSNGSTTSFSNSIPAWEEMDLAFKELIKPLRMKFIPVTTVSNALPESWKVSMAENWQPEIVYKNIAGKEGLFFPYLEVHHFLGMSEEESKPIINKLANYLLQEKYVYDHHWEDGDIVISEQWLGLHKRWKFYQLEKRLLHRIATGFPDQDYTVGT
jgi:taurine dioxygenase